MAYTPTVACLHTSKGPLYFYDTSSIVKVLSQFPDTAPDDVKGDMEMRQALHPVLFEGFTAEAWCQFGKKKSNIASRLGRENGALKARISVLEDGAARFASTVSGDGSRVADPVYTSDPWANKYFASVPVDTSKLDGAGEDAWSQWLGSITTTSALSNRSKLEGEGKNELEGVHTV